MPDDPDARYEAGVAVFRCSTCGTAVTPELTALPAMPAEPGWLERDADTRRARSTVPRGHYAVDPEPFGPPYEAQEDQDDPEPSNPRGVELSDERGILRSAGTPNTVVVHPADVPGLHPFSGGSNTIGCCGPAGTDGLNRACSCGAGIATLAADCSGPYELRLEPARVSVSGR